MENYELREKWENGDFDDKWGIRPAFEEVVEVSQLAENSWPFDYTYPEAVEGVDWPFSHEYDEQTGKPISY